MVGVGVYGVVGNQKWWSGASRDDGGGVSKGHGGLLGSGV